MSSEAATTPLTSLAVCIPTCGRPDAIKNALQNLAEVNATPGAVLVVDASADRGTEVACREMSSLFPDGVLRYVRSERGLPLQRCHGIELLRPEGFRYVCMLDDDVTLAPDFLDQVVGFLESDRGRGYGGISGYGVLDWGKPFDRRERLYSRLGLYKGELRPGRWLYCGRLLTLAHLGPFEGIHPSDYIPGGHTIWRMEVFDRFLPPRALSGYALWEDVHLSLRVGTAYHLGVLGQAHASHHHAAGGRPGRVRLGFQSFRRQALLLRDCDPHPTLRRYLAFLGFSFLDLLVRTVARSARLRFGALPHIFGSAAGWLSCVVRPPVPTSDSLGHLRVGPGPDALAGSRR